MNSIIKVLHLTTHNEECGIARYQEQFVDGMKGEPIENVFFDVSPNKTRFMSKREYAVVLKRFKDELKGFDILHIQHELSFYKHRELQSVITAAHKLNIKVIVTIHTALDVEYTKAHLHIGGPKVARKIVSEVRAQKRFEQVHLNPLKKADVIVVHNDTTRQSLLRYGFESFKVVLIRMPVPKLSFETKSTEITRALKLKKGDTIYCTVGFITQSKGVDEAVKALTYLPENFKLAIIGGLHPNGGNSDFLNQLTDYIEEKDLKSRVYITGYIEDDDRLNALIRECDICVYAYDAKYYSFVSSASLSNAMANHKATVAYPTQSLLETNSEIDVIAFTRSPNYYELAREINNIDIVARAKTAKRYAELYAYGKEAQKFATIYQRLAATT